MRIALVHNPDAGHGDVDRGDLRRLFEMAGHEVEGFGRKNRGVKEAIAWNPDILAVAGGDGTVARAAIASFRKGSSAPLLVLPVGTANNIARTLGMTRSPAELIRDIPITRHARLDIWRIRRPDDERLFVEGAGVGFLGAMLHSPMTPAKRLFSAVRGVLTRTDIAARIAGGVERFIRAQKPFAVSLIADGVDLSGEYIAAEALNIREVGPHLELAPTADFGDGMLDLVLRRDAKGASYITRARRIEMSWRAEYGHVDDEPWPEEKVVGDTKVSIAIAGHISAFVRRP